MPHEDRDLRQRDLVPPQGLARTRVTIIGVGAIGRQVALQLAAMGAPQLQLIDPQSVEPVNLAAQGYMHEDLDQPKVEATARMCSRLQPDIAIELVIGRFRRSFDVGNVIFCCVDSIATRELIWNAVGVQAPLFVDGRMSAEMIRVLAVNDQTTRNHYPSTLFAPSEAHTGSCTGRSTLYTANVAAGLMLAQFTRHLRNLPIDADVQLNLLSMELDITPLAGP